MTPEITLFSVIMLLGSAHGLFLALALINAKGGNSTSHLFLALLTLAFAIDLGHEFLYQSHYLLKVLILAYIDPVINLLYGPSFYLYVRALTEGGTFTLKGKWLLHFLPVCIGIVVCLLLPELTPEQFTKMFYQDVLTDIPGKNIVQSSIGAIATSSVLSIGIYLALSIKRLARHARIIRQQFSSIERITLNWLRNLLIALSLLYLTLLFDGFFSRSFGFDESINNLLYIMLVAVIYTMGYLGLRQPNIFAGPAIDVDDSITTHVEHTVDKQDTPNTAAKYKTSSLDSDMSTALREELKCHMERENPHLDSKLTLSQLAKQVGISPNYLSQVINEQFEKNFFDFINDYRVEEAKRILADSNNTKLSIIGVAYEAGFNSNSAFYTAFKKNVGVTPSEFRAECQQ